MILKIKLPLKLKKEEFSIDLRKNVNFLNLGNLDLRIVEMIF